MKYFILLLTATMLISCDAFFRKTVNGNGDLIVAQRNLSPFQEVLTEGNLRVELSYSDECRVEVEADNNLQKFIQTKVNDDKLVLKVQKGVRLKSDNPMVIKVAMPNITALNNSGSGTVTTIGKLKGSGAVKIESSGSGSISLRLRAPAVKATISGSGNINLSGETKEVKFKINGSGKILADSLKSETADVVINGSGRIKLYAETSLKSVINGSGSIDYMGSPEVSSKINGSGKMSRISSQ